MEWRWRSLPPRNDLEVSSKSISTVNLRLRVGESHMRFADLWPMTRSSAAESADRFKAPSNLKRLFSLCEALSQPLSSSSLGSADGRPASGSAVSCRPSCPRATPATQACEEWSSKCEMRCSLLSMNESLTTCCPNAILLQVACALGPGKPAVALRLEPDPGGSPGRDFANPLMKRSLCDLFAPGGCQKALGRGSPRRDARRARRTAEPPPRLSDRSFLACLLSFFLPKESASGT